MLSKARLYLTEDRKTVVPDGDKRAKFLLVAAGAEIPDATLAKYEGAAELAAGKTLSKAEQKKEDAAEAKKEAAEEKAEAAAEKKHHGHR